MSKKLVLGVSGNLTRPSKTKGVHRPHSRTGSKKYRRILGHFRYRGSRAVLRACKADRSTWTRQLETSSNSFRSAVVLVVGSPTFKGSYTGLFKHFFDLLDPSSLKRKAGHSCRDRRWRASFAHRGAPASAALRLLRGADHPDRNLCLRQGLRRWRPRIRSDPRPRAASRRRSMPGGRRTPTASASPPEALRQQRGRTDVSPRARSTDRPCHAVQRRSQ